MFNSISYNPLSPECEEFEPDYEIFKAKSEGLERRLCSVFEQALDDISDITSFMKVIID